MLRGSREHSTPVKHHAFDLVNVRFWRNGVVQETKKRLPVGNLRRAAGFL